MLLLVEEPVVYFENVLVAIHQHDIHYEPFNIPQPIPMFQDKDDRAITPRVAPSS